LHLKLKKASFLNDLLFSDDMEGIIANYRRGIHNQYDKQMVIQVDGYTKKDKSASLIGKKVVWTNSQGTKIEGKISAAHGNKGAVRVIFEKGMPGQAIGNKVQIE
jgi:large subunit ribosomal protein L35Ae